MKMELKIGMVVLFLKLALLFFMHLFTGCTGSLLVYALSLVMESRGLRFSCGAWLLVVEHTL